MAKVIESIITNCKFINCTHAIYKDSISTFTNCVIYKNPIEWGNDKGKDANNSK